jgi:hypothetical protein
MPTGSQGSLSSGIALVERAATTESIAKSHYAKTSVQADQADQHYVRYHPGPVGTQNRRDERSHAKGHVHVREQLINDSRQPKFT